MDTDEIFLSLRGEFLDESRDRLGQMEERLNGLYTGSMGSHEALTGLRREAHTLKGLGNAFGFSLISVLTHRLEDYMADLGDISAERSKDIQFYIDRMRDIVIRGENPDEEEGRELLLTLPVYKKSSALKVDELPIEVLLVSESRTIRRKIGDELGAFGFRVINVSNAMDALNMAVGMHPDIIITTEVMKGINGFDLIRALLAMSITKHIPVALLTSYDAEHPDILSLPADVPVIQMGPEMTDKLALTLSSLEYRFLGEN